MLRFGALEKGHGEQSYMTQTKREEETKEAEIEVRIKGGEVETTEAGVVETKQTGAVETKEVGKEMGETEGEAEEVEEGGAIEDVDRVSHQTQGSKLLQNQKANGMISSLNGPMMTP